MSDSVLKIIPADPNYVPSSKSQEEAVEILKSHVPQSESVIAHVSDEVEFIDAGENWGEIKCPVCEATIDADWWGDAMSNAAEHSFRQLVFESPCCGSEVSLNDLRYDWNVGFARFVLEVMNPNVATIDDNVRNNIDEVLGCNTKIVWAHI